MKKYGMILCVLAVSLIVGGGCTIAEKGQRDWELNPDRIVTVEGCEYFKVSAYLSSTYVHKGNCKNPIHYENRKK